MYNKISYPIRYFMILDSVIYQRIKKKKKELDSFRPLSPSLANRLHEQVLVNWTYNSNAIEGSSLTLRETQLVLEEGLTIGGKPLKDHLAAINHKEAIDYLEDVCAKKERISLSLVNQIHQLVLKKIDDQNAGKLRQVEVMITGSNYVPPDPSLVPKLMVEFDQWLRKKRKPEEIIDFAAQAHFRLVDIHPYVDGNGRTARLLMSLVLMKEGYPPVVILKTDRKQYYRFLEQGHQGKIKPFVNFIGRQVERTLALWLEAVTPQAKKKADERLILLSQLAPQTPYSQEYLSLLARRGKLEAVKKGRNWYSSRQAVENYRQSLGRA